MPYYSSSSLKWPDPGPMSVPDYQVSALPWVTSSVATTTAAAISFPTTTRWVEVRNLGANALRVGFSANGVNANPPSQAHYFTLPASSAALVSPTTARWELRCSRLFIAAAASTTTYSLIAGLTGIPGRYFTDMSASLGTFYNGIG
jgi:hypothetical protein